MEHGSSKESHSVEFHLLHSHCVWVAHCKEKGFCATQTQIQNLLATILGHIGLPSSGFPVQMGTTRFNLITTFIETKSCISCDVTLQMVLLKYDIVARLHKYVTLTKYGYITAPRDYVLAMTITVWSRTRPLVDMSEYIFLGHFWTYSNAGSILT